MMKKRIVSLGLAAMMTAGLFAGCGNSSESQGTLFSATEMFIHLIQNSELIMTLQI